MPAKVSRATPAKNAACKQEDALRRMIKKEEAEQEHPFVLFLTLLCFNTSFIQAVFRYNNK
jgi:hypothetical protein